MQEILTVSEITGQIKKSLETDFERVSVIGEISNFKSHFSGHWYFTLKDAGSQISCTMWKGFNSTVYFSPQDGMKIYVNGKISVYPPRGTYQIDVRSMKPAGEGELQAAFEKLKRKLSDEGLFDVQFKKEIPRFPQKIGIVTAGDSAAFRDLMSVASRRYPLVKIILGSSKVQGEGAAKEIARRINELNRVKGIDLIIISRGGGSLEDLWAFNEEIVARSIFNSKVPIISGVGHEVDYTIADFVSDLRAPTPTAAMELATPNKEDILQFISEKINSCGDSIADKFQNYREEIESFAKSYGYRIPENIVREKSQQLDNLMYKVTNSITAILNAKSNKLKIAEAVVKGHDHKKILGKGFTMISQNGKFISRSSEFSRKIDFTIRFKDKDVKVGKDDKKESK
ncbi:MAG: exodeoxyribonuclease VII large subunit [Melioribacteraceae bacterium]|nr:exodeoxyribonuclease VII large subunit [Melioribacteraceae bacterium]MCF8265646.1 exodeoxyribonuclease VII large subunit [Melioribacteraceae bacterium]MCF8432464.1 exodeoxyribonuclease VII large subunit [Melioribacteraceae bacterium]